MIKTGKVKRISFCIVITAMLGLAMFNSCSKDGDLQMENIESRVFDLYLADNGIDGEPTSSGLYYIEEQAGTGESPLPGDFVRINYTLYTIENDLMVFSTSLTESQRTGIYDDRVLYGPHKIRVGDNLPGLDEGLVMMKEGGKASLLFKSDLGYGNEFKGPIPPFSPLKIEVSLLEVIKDPVVAEYEATLQYIMANGLKADSTAEGLYYTETESGTGWDVTLANGDNVTMSITGKLLDGRVFYENSEFPVTLGSEEKDVTEGLNIGLTYMRPGTSAVIVVPYQLGYHESGYVYYNGYVKTPIPPYSSLVYEISIGANDVLRNPLSLAGGGH